MDRYLEELERRSNNHHNDQIFTGIILINVIIP